MNISKQICRGVGKAMLFLPFLLLVDFLEPSFNTNIYYVDATLGSDSNTGTSPSSAWKTINRVNKSSFLPGDSVLFKRGEIWREQLTVPSSGAAGNFITFGAYSTGAKPIFLGSTLKNNAEDWMNGGGNMWSTHNVLIDIGHIAIGLNVLSSKESSKLSMATQGDFYYDFTENTLWMYSINNPALFYGNNLEIALDTPHGGIVTVSQREYIKIENLDIQRGGGHGIQTDKAFNIVIQDCDVSYIGGAYLYGTTRYGNGIELWDNAKSITVQRCKVSYTFDEGITAQYIQGANNVTHSDIYIQDNIVDRCGRGMAHSIQTTGTATGSNIYWRRNTFSNNGLGWAIPGVSNGEGKGAQINCTWNSISNFNFTDNTIETTASGQDPFGQGILLIGGHANILRNKIHHAHNNSIRVYNNFSGIIAYNICYGFDDKPAFFITGQEAVISVFNNIFFKTSNASFPILEIGQRGYPVSNIEIKNNILADYGTNNRPILSVSTDSTAITDNNLYYRNTGPLIMWNNGVTYNVTDWASYKTASGQDTHSPVPQDPKFFSISVFDFRLLTNSPCNEAGVNVDLALDFLGKPVPAWPGKNPDIGAFESSYGTPSSTLNLNRTRLVFGAVAGGPITQPQSVTINNSGDGTLNWTATLQQSWITSSKTSGTNSAAINIGVNPAGLAPGKYAGQITITAPGAINSPGIIGIDLTVYASGAESQPFGAFETPRNGTAVAGSIPVTGWALDEIGVDSVKIYRDPVAADPPGTLGLIYIGDAQFIDGARPDVEQTYSAQPMSYRAGWGHMVLTNFLPNQGNGTFAIHAVAVNKAGKQTDLGTKTIVCDNAHAVMPFGTIDTPSQGGISWGSGFTNFGWVLTPLPNTIPVDGSTLTVWVDGKAVGRPVYNNYRDDIATKFPGLANTNGAVGYFSLDTTAYTEGIHTIAWGVTDSGGNADGIGSRYFLVQNSGAGAPQRTESVSKLLAFTVDIPVKTMPNSFAPVFIKRGFDARMPKTSVYPENDGEIRLKIRELERLEIDLDGQATISGGGQYAGYLVVGDEMRPLPIGSTLDLAGGVFTWLPGPGFVGEYELVFIKKGRESTYKKTFRVLIEPK